MPLPLTVRAGATGCHRVINPSFKITTINVNCAEPQSFAIVSRSAVSTSLEPDVQADTEAFVPVDPRL